MNNDTIVKVQLTNHFERLVFSKFQIWLIVGVAFIAYPAYLILKGAPFAILFIAILPAIMGYFSLNSALVFVHEIYLEGQHVVFKYSKGSQNNLKLSIPKNKIKYLYVNEAKSAYPPFFRVHNERKVVLVQYLNPGWTKEKLQVISNELNEIRRKSSSPVKYIKY